MFVVIGPVWQTMHAVGWLPPWASTIFTKPPPFELLWQTRQVPRGRALFWYWRAWKWSTALSEGIWAWGLPWQAGQEMPLWAMAFR